MDAAPRPARIRLHRRDGPQFLSCDQSAIRRGNDWLVARRRGLSESRRQPDTGCRASSHSRRAKADLRSLRSERSSFSPGLAAQSVRPDSYMDTVSIWLEIWIAFLARFLSGNPQPEAG